MKYKFLLVIFAIILLLVINNSLKNNKKEAFENNKYYKHLTDNWGNIFEDGNRNSASSLFVKFILSIPNLSFNDFMEYNKLYCAVSGSLISPGRDPSFIAIQELNTNQKICGQYYKCCWPCLCDVMKYAKVVKMKHTFSDGEKTVYAITIGNPCSKSDFPSEINKSYICNGNNINKQKNFVLTEGGEERLVIGFLHNGHVCSDEELKQIENDEVTGKRCNRRNNMPLDELQYGMGSIFIKLAK